jgi:osmotically-inducible protein OsmY
VDERFQNVYGDVVDGAVFLRGTVRRGEDQFALATLISKLPGVTRVVLQDVRVQGNR